MKKRFFQTLIAILFTASGQAAYGYSFDLFLITEFSGATPSTGPVKATFEDLSADTVRLTIDSSAFDNTYEYISGFYFNYSHPVSGPALSGLSFSYLSGIVGTAGTIDKSGLALNTTNCSGTGCSNTFKADGDGYYDVVFSYPTSGTKFTDEKKSAFSISGTGLTASMFEVASVGGDKGAFFAAAKVQSIGASGGPSGWMGASIVTAIPEPETYALLLAGLGLLGFAARRRKLKEATAA